MKAENGVIGGDGSGGVHGRTGRSGGRRGRATGVALGLESTPDKVTYGTEAGVYTAGGIPCVVCGPGDIGDAHRPDESIALDQLAECGPSSRG